MTQVMTLIVTTMMVKTALMTPKNQGKMMKKGKTLLVMILFRI